MNLDRFGAETLMLIPCCANKSAGGKTRSRISDTLRNSVSKNTYAQVLMAREQLLDALQKDVRYTSNKFSKNKKLRKGADFGQTDSSGEYLPAVERYTGHLYSAHQDVASVIRDDVNTEGRPKLLILSALYGPLHPLSPIQDYNLQMSDSPAKRTWQIAFAQFLESYVGENGIRSVRMYFGLSTAYFKVAQQAVAPLLAGGRLDKAYQYDVVNGNSYHTPHNHGLLVLSALRKRFDPAFTRAIEVNEL